MYSHKQTIRLKSPASRLFSQPMTANRKIHDNNSYILVSNRRKRYTLCILISLAIISAMQNS